MHEQLVSIETDTMHIEGRLEMPERSSGIVLFAHGGGDSAAPDAEVASALHGAGIGTLLLDLLNDKEESDYYTRFDITLLAQRLDKAIAWLEWDPHTRSLPLGLFGAGTGAAAAFQLAAWRGNRIAAAVALAGRVDMAGRQALDKVRAPTLLIVGGLDREIVDLNRMAFSALHCDKQFEVVNGAGHLLSEPGALQAAITLAGDWFSRHFSGHVSSL